jgi:hypothetical protein
MPIHSNIPRVGAYEGGERKLMSDWIEAHNKFSCTLYALFASQGVIGPAATPSRNILVSYQFSGSGAQILQDLVSLHHPGHKRMQSSSLHAGLQFFPKYATTSPSRRSTWSSHRVFHGFWQLGGPFQAVSQFQIYA